MKPLEDLLDDLLKDERYDNLNKTEKALLKKYIVEHTKNNELKIYTNFINYPFGFKHNIVLPNTNVKTLRIDVDYISEIIPNNNLEMLQISDKIIKKIPAMDNLKTIIASHCYKLEEIEYMKSLTYIDCSYCDNLKFLSHDFKLENLFAARTQIDFVDYKSLVRLLIDYNECIKEIPIIPSLIYLSCRNTKITKLPEELCNLVHLNIDNCNIDKIPSTYKSIERLYISNTKINELDETLNLTELDVSKTTIKEIPESYVNLVHLNVNNTDVKSIPKIFKNMHTLHIDNTSITRLPYEFEDIFMLSCCYSKIKFIPESYTQLWMLHMSDDLVKPSYTPRIFCVFIHHIDENGKDIVKEQKYR